MIKQFKGIVFDSRLVKKNFVFVAIKGLTNDGHDFIKQAAENGATLIIGEKDRPSFLDKKIAYRKVKDSRKELGMLTSDFYGNPSDKLIVIGVTGTKGKTTTTHMISHILNVSGSKTGMVSSLMAKVGEKEIDLGFHVTNPDVVSLNKFLYEMVKAECKYAVLEVSSHGIEQGRVEGINFEVTVLTNIKPEHLDYHKTFENYKKTKLNWFKTGKIQVKSPLKTDLNIFPGEFNNINASTAIAVAQKLGFRIQDTEKAIKTFKLPVGRMEEIATDRGFRVFIDFAHTPDSLKKALTHLKSLKPNHLISIFGCAGERDPYKRPEMGKISTKLANLSIFTAEDPRSEDISKIIKAIEKGAVNKKFVSIPERGEAIAYALSHAKKGDVIGIFGKGHEKSMNLDGIHETPWSDQKKVVKVLESISKS